MDYLEPVKRGRRARVTKDEYEAVLLKYKDKLVRNDKLVPRTNNVWEDIAAELGGRVKSNTVFSVTTSNRYGLLNMVYGREIEEDSLDVDSEIAFDADSDQSFHSDLQKQIFFTMTFGKSEFQELIRETSYVVKRGKKKMLRTYTILQQNKWAEVMAKKVYDEVKLEHGFHFKKHYVFRDTTGGSCIGEYPRELSC